MSDFKGRALVMGFESAHGLTAPGCQKLLAVQAGDVSSSEQCGQRLVMLNVRHGGHPSRGTSGIIHRLSHAIESGVAEGSLSVDAEPESIAQSLYQLWLDASLMLKIVRNTQPFESAMMTPSQILHLSLLESVRDHIVL